MIFNSKSRKILTAVSLSMLLAAPCVSTALADTPAAPAATGQKQSKTLQDGTYAVDLHFYNSTTHKDSMAQNFIAGSNVVVQNHQIKNVIVHFDLSKLPASFEAMAGGKKLDSIISSLTINRQNGTKSNVGADGKKFDFTFAGNAYKEGKGELKITINIFGGMNEGADAVFGALPAKAYETPTPAAPSHTEPSTPVNTSSSQQTTPPLATTTKGESTTATSKPDTKKDEKPAPAKPAQPTKVATKKYVLKHNAYLYNKNGKRIGKKTVKAGKAIKAVGIKVINGVKYCQLSKNKFIKADNIVGHKRTLKHNAYIYHKNGRHYGKLLRKGRKVTTYGSAIKLHGKRYYHITANKYIKVANF